MVAKLTVTTACGARCATCPGWKRKAEHGEYATLIEVWSRLVTDPAVSKIIVNNTGDIYAHPDHVRLLKFFERAKNGRFVAIVTNGAGLDYVPAFDHFILSFNGGDRESYERTTGLSWDDVRARVEAAMPRLTAIYPRERIELHCLGWDATAGAEARITEAWETWPGRIRVSRKYDNQGEADHTIERFRTPVRIPCDYLETLSVQPDGRVIMCAHDWKESEVWGSVLEGRGVELIEHPGRQRKMREHLRREWTGACERCNYNVPITDQIQYVR